MKLLEIVLAACAALVIALLGHAVLSAVVMEPTTVDVTASYDIEDILPWHRVYRVRPSGAFGQTLYVIVRDREPVAIMWDSGGKNSHRVGLVTPFQGGKHEK